jgi:hypothetical protein
MMMNNASRFNAASYTMGLSHDGINSEVDYNGHGNWAPVCGLLTQ